MHGHITKLEVLQEANRLAKANQGAPGIDGKSFEDVEREGLEGFLEGIRRGRLGIRSYSQTTLHSGSKALNSGSPV
jgi:hypothetical protein